MAAFDPKRTFVSNDRAKYSDLQYAAVHRTIRIWGHTGGATECARKIRWIAVANLRGDVFERNVGLDDQPDGLFKAGLIDDFAKSQPFSIKVTLQGADANIKFFG